jgi:hypothetical protein
MGLRALRRGLRASVITLQTDFDGVFPQPAESDAINHVGPHGKSFSETELRERMRIAECKRSDTKRKMCCGN